MDAPSATGLITPDVIDADTHVAESSAMWTLIEDSWQPRRPVVVTAPTDTVYGRRNAFWMIDGQIVPRPLGKAGVPLITPSESEFQMARTDIQVGARELTDVIGRLRDMDQLGIATQIIFPTLFLVHVTEDAALEVALCRAYNQFMADACTRSGGRLRWVAVLPLQSIDESINQLRDARVHGAAGVFFRGIEGARTLDDPYFFPIYEESAGLDIPICIHTGAGCPALSEIFDRQRNSGFPYTRLPVLVAFRDLLANGIPRQFPHLRFGFIEAGGTWVPFVLHVLKRMFKDHEAQWGPRVFEQNRFYVACEADEDILYLLNYIPDDHLVIGSDYGHNDQAEEPKLRATIQSRDDLSDTIKRNLLRENAARFYGL